MLVILCPVLIRENVVTNNLPKFYNQIETLTIKLNFFTSNFFLLIFKFFKNKCRTAILQISFLERKYFGIYMGVAKHLKNCVTVECVQSFLKIFNFPSVRFARAPKMPLLGF